MFGYVRYSKGELTINEYENYRAVYCSFCKYLGKNYGILSRFTLSYDFTFLLLVNMAMDTECPEFNKGRCTFNPLKKCNYCKKTDALKMPAAASIIMFYYKLCDNIGDNRGLKKLVFKIAKLIFSGKHKKAAKLFPEIEETVSSYIENQSKLEKENTDSVDKAADPTATALSEILSLCSEDETQKRVLKRMGYCIGRYVYIIDAAHDFGEDVISGNYNVFKHNYKTKEEVNKRAIPLLYMSITEAQKAFELADFKRFKTILANVLYLGLEDTFKKELKDEKSI